MFENRLLGLGDTARFVSGIRDGHLEKYVELPDGSRLSAARAVELDRLWAESRFGKVPPDFAEALEAVPSTQRYRVAVALPVAEHLRALRHATTDRAERRAELQHEIWRQAADLAPRLVGLGMRDVRVSRGLFPGVYASGTPEMIRAAGWLPGVARVLDITPALAERRANLPHFHTAHHKIHAFHDAGIFATNEPVGIIEGANCGIWEEHETFEQLGGGQGFAASGSINYQDPSLVPTGCSSDAECATLCNDTRSPGEDGLFECVSGTCVAHHATWVASVLTASDASDSYAAGQARLFIPNVGTDAYGWGEQMLCNPEAIEGAYAWLDANDVKVVNESWGCVEGDVPWIGQDGMVEDYYSRYAGIFTVKANGRQLFHGCPYTLNSLCVGQAEENDTHNPFYNAWWNPMGTDREEPDLLALGEWVYEVAEVGTYNSYVSAGGSSMAAPSVASVAALLRERCETPVEMTPAAYRAFFVGGGWRVNVEGGPYSRPGDSTDDKDGGGRLQMAGMAGACEDGDLSTAIDDGDTDHPDGSGLGSIDVDTSTDGEPVPIPPNEDDIESAETLLNAPANLADWRMLRLGDPFVAHAGDRLRRTMSWEACLPVSWPVGSSYAEVATDYDIALRNEDTGEFVWGSFSFHDNIEGFDVVIPEGEGDGATYAVYLLFDRNSPGCDGDTRERSRSIGPTG